MTGKVAMTSSAISATTGSPHPLVVSSDQGRDSRFIGPVEPSAFVVKPLNDLFEYCFGHALQLIAHFLFGFHVLRAYHHAVSARV